MLELFNNNSTIIKLFKFNTTFTLLIWFAPLNVKFHPIYWNMYEGVIKMYCIVEMPHVYILLHVSWLYAYIIMCPWKFVCPILGTEMRIVCDAKRGCQSLTWEVLASSLLSVFHLSLLSFNTLICCSVKHPSALRSHASMEQYQSGFKVR